MIGHQFNCQWVEWRAVVDAIFDTVLMAIVAGVVVAVWLFVICLTLTMWRNRGSFNGKD